MFVGTHPFGISEPRLYAQIKADAYNVSSGQYMKGSCVVRIERACLLGLFVDTHPFRISEPTQALCSDQSWRIRCKFREIYKGSCVVRIERAYLLGFFVGTHPFGMRTNTGSMIRSKLANTM